MKRLISIFILPGFLFILSCNDDFLERHPLDELSPGEYFKSADELRLYVNRFYPLLPAHQGYTYTFWFDRNSDDLVPAAFDTRLAGTRTVPASAEAGGWTWSDIRQANYFLEHSYRATGAKEEVRHFIGEGYFFRAFLYFQKLKTFGNVPWISTALDTESDELFYPRENREEIVYHMIEDLDSAVANLKSFSQAEADRINKEVAMLLKARICLYEGTWEKYHSETVFGVAGSDGTAFLELAALTASNLMDQGIFSIYVGPAGKEYWSLFIQFDYSGNPEVMLWKRFDEGLQITHNVNRYLPFGSGRIGMSKELIDSYLCTDGAPVSASPLFMGYNSMTAEAMNRDPRLAQSLFLKGYDQTINSPGGLNDNQFNLPSLDGVGEFLNTTGYAMYKGANPEYSQQINNDIGTQGSIIFRYAEALLIYAEARAELGTVTQADIDRTVNVLRDRVGMIHMDLNNITYDPEWDFPELSPVINEIRRERRVELVCEGFRWDDLARWRAHQLIVGKRMKGVKYIGSDLEGAYKDYMGNPTLFVGVNLFVDENGFIDPYQKVLPEGFGFDPGRDYLSPIPSDEITLNSNLTQNPGWD